MAKGAIVSRASRPHSSRGDDPPYPPMSAWRRTEGRRGEVAGRRGEGEGRRVLPGARRIRSHTERMWMDAERDDEEFDEDSDASGKGAWDLSDHGAYWRRRFFILCAGMVALGVCAWLLPGARQAHGTSAAARASMA